MKSITKACSNICIILMLSSLFLGLTQCQFINVCTDEKQVSAVDRKITNYQYFDNLPFVVLDADGDGYTGRNICNYGSQNDCNDKDPKVYPGSLNILPNQPNHNQLIGVRFRHFDSSESEKRVYYGRNDLGSLGQFNTRLANGAAYNYREIGDSNSNRFIMTIDPVNQKMTMKISFKAEMYSELKLQSTDFNSINGVKIMVKSYSQRESGKINYVALDNLKYDGVKIGEGKFENKNQSLYDEWYFDLCFNHTKATEITGNILFNSNGISSRGENSKIEIFLIKLLK